MMYELIKKIIEKAEVEKVDIGVAQRMLIAEGENNEDMTKALEIYTKSYEEISELYRKEDFENIKKVVELTEAKKYFEVAELMEEIRKQG